MKNFCLFHLEIVVLWKNYYLIVSVKQCPTTTPASTTPSPVHEERLFRSKLKLMCFVICVVV